MPSQYFKTLWKRGNTKIFLQEEKMSRIKTSSDMQEYVWFFSHPLLESFWEYAPVKGALLVAQMVKHLPIMQETLVWSLGQEDPLEKEMATHSSTLAWRIPWMEKPGELQSMGSQRVRHNWAISQKEGSNPKDMSQKSKPKKKELTQTGRY